MNLRVYLLIRPKVSVNPTAVATTTVISTDTNKACSNSSDAKGTTIATIVTSILSVVFAGVAAWAQWKQYRLKQLLSEQGLLPNRSASPSPTSEAEGSPPPTNTIIPEPSNNTAQSSPIQNTP